MPSWRNAIFSFAVLLTACQSTHVTPQTQPAPTGPASFDPAVTLPYLASDELEGRGVGTAGLDTAAQFIADHFRQAGLKPLAALGSYFQPFDFVTSSKPSPQCRLTLAGKPLILDQDFRPLTITGEGKFSGPILFAGYGITAPSQGYDDYANLNAQNKIVLAMRFEPMTQRGKSLFASPGVDWSDEARLDNKIQNAKRHGAVALILFTPAGLQQSDPLPRFVPSTAQSQGLPANQIKRSFADQILSAPIRYSPDGKPLASVNPGANATGNVTIERTSVPVKNVIACVPGTGPRADEYIIVGAHYDHLGRGKTSTLLGKSGAIFHGADDNASGTATLLELAQRIAAHPRERSIVFCSFTAEEEGLIGSLYFAAHPPLNLNKVAFMLNMDMVGRMKDNVIYVGGAATARDFPAMLKLADFAGPLKIKTLPVSFGGAGGLGPSDHMSFSLHKIPILMLFSGMHPDYHRPTDTSDKINYAGIQEVADFAAQLIDELAAAPREPYDSSSDLLSQTFGILPAASDHLPGAALGVTIGPSPDEPQIGIPIRQVLPASAAANAGMLPGDVVLRFGTHDLYGPADLLMRLELAHPGDKVTLTVRRGTRTLLLQVTLDERKG